MYVVTGEEMSSIDRRAIEEYKIPSIVLMENAALRSACIIEREYEIDGKNIIILAGGGNNGGDGLAIARHLYLAGAKVKIFAIFARERSRGDAKTNLEGVEALSIPTVYISSYEDIIQLEDSLRKGDLLVDALFGTGLSRPIEGVAGDVIDIVNRYDVPVVAIDIPSGIEASTGRSMGHHIRAAHTITFGYPKRGHYLYPGRECAGKLHVVPISLPKDSAKAAGVTTFTLSDMEAGSMLKPRPQDSHKGTFGKVGVVAGSRRYTGAAYLTSCAAQRAGAGLVTLAVPREIQPIMAGKLTEVMTYPLEDDGAGLFNADAGGEAVQFLQDKDAIALGPGMGVGEHLFEFIRYILGKIDISIVIDADGLNNISKDIGILASYRGSIVLTPHPGEMARLTGRSIEYILADPVESALELSKRTGAIVLLKGATTVVTNSAGEVYINQTGNSGMASGGSGDVLTGIIASFIAQGYDAFLATVLGSFVHGRAGDIAASEQGEAGLIAHDILDTIPYALKKLNDTRS